MSKKLASIKQDSRSNYYYNDNDDDDDDDDSEGLLNTNTYDYPSKWCTIIDQDTNQTYANKLKMLYRAESDSIRCQKKSKYLSKSMFDLSGDDDGGDDEDLRASSSISSSSSSSSLDSTSNKNNKKTFRPIIDDSKCYNQLSRSLLIRPVPNYPAMKAIRDEFETKKSSKDSLLKKSLRKLSMRNLFSRTTTTTTTKREQEQQQQKQQKKRTSIIEKSFFYD